MSASTSSAQITTTKQHVPAWKRIGLKLKYAKDTAEEPAPVPEQPAQTRLESSKEPKAAKRQRGEDSESATAPKSAKKRKTVTEVSREGDSEPSKAASTSGASFSAQPTTPVPATGAAGEIISAKESRQSKSATDRESEQATPEQAKSTRPDVVTRRKSVAFTPDTKADDGFSAQRIFKEGPSDEPTPSSDQEPEQSSPSTSKSTKKDKKDKKRSKHQQAVADTNGAPVPQTAKQAEQDEKKEAPEYIRYLQQYYSDKASWKFNKNKQKDLLKNLFNVYRIPPEHNQALVAYIAGLQGIAVQHRVIEDAEDVFKKLLEKQERGAEIEEMGSPAARKAAYEAALQREIEKVERSGAGRSEYDEQQLQEIRQEVERGRRADAVLSELLTKELGRPTSQLEPSSGPSNTNRTAPTEHSATSTVPAVVPAVSASVAKPKRKKRKTRTEASSSESSSSSSHSEGE